MATEGGIAALLAAMHAHPASARVQAEGCGALCNLAASNDANWRAIAQVGGAGAVVGAMLAHASEEDVQVHLTQCINRMVLESHLSQRIVNLLF